MKTITACRITITGIFLMLLGLILSCQNPIGETSRHNETESQIPAGQGRFLMENLPANVSPRTVIPGTIAIKKYRVTLAPPADSSWRPVDKTYDAGETVREDVGPGKWSGNVYAYGLDTVTPIAQADVDFEISAGEVKYVPVILRWNSAETLNGNGTVNIKLNFPGQLTMADVTEAKLSISKLDDSLVVNNLKLDEGDNKIALASGVYIGRLAINDRWQRAGYFTEAIWIYPGETSVWKINASNEFQEGEYGEPILVISVNPLKPPTLLSPIMECERGVTVVYSLLGSDGQYEKIRWYADGVVQTAANDKMTLNFPTRNRTTGKNEILVVVSTNDGLTLSASTRLNILPGNNDEVYHIRDENELMAALENISVSTKTEATICIEQDFTVHPVTLGPQFANKEIQLVVHNGEKTISLASNGSMFSISNGVVLAVSTGLILEGIAATSSNDPNDWTLDLRPKGTVSGGPNRTGFAGNNSPLVRVDGGEFILQGVLRGNSMSVTKNRDNTIAVGGIFAQNNARVILDGGLAEDLYADHHYPYESYWGIPWHSIGAVYAKDSTFEMKNGARINRAVSDIEEDPSYSISALFLDGESRGVISNSVIENSNSSSGNFASFAATVFVSDTSRLTIEADSQIIDNVNWIGDLYNNAGTVLINGILEMKSGVIARNKLYWSHRYTISFIFGSSGVYVGKQGTLNKTGGKVCGNDDPANANMGVSLRVLQNEQERGSVTVGATAYYAVDNRCVNLSF